jgi:asparagine synthase (glutamine-hydrolysing)
MCGIAALWGHADQEVTEAIVSKLEHRGPDGRGVHVDPDRHWALGHRRLSIIDPPGGAQPILDARSASALVANGMIYNDEQLRREIGEEAFSTATDSESILRSVQHWGADAAARLDGMFAFVLMHDEGLLAARDPIGIKPLYMGWVGDGLAFASEVKALAGIADNIKEFPAGQIYDSRCGFRRYYDVPKTVSPEGTSDGIIDNLRRTLEAAVVKRLRSDVPLGAFLSGGLDSSIIAALAKRHLDVLHTFAVGLEGSADLLAARRVADHLGTIHHEYRICQDEVRRDLPEILFHLESFDRDLVRSAVPCWYVSKLASDRVKVVLTGEGADELFAGYTYYRDYDDPDALQQELSRSILRMHNINLQRVDRMTMAHGLEGRVPFLDTSMIEFAMAIPAELKLRGVGERRVEKWILRKAFEDLLPEDIVWRDKAQFDEGSGLADLLAAEAAARGGPAQGRSAEEAHYRSTLASTFDEPEPVLSLVAHWNDRAAA